MTYSFHLASDKLWDGINENFGTSGGAYRLFVREAGVTIKIGRLLSVDDQGTLYIGKADSYLNRIIGLKKTICPNYKSNPHICGRGYYLNPDIVKAFPYENLYVELYSDLDPVIAEAKLINIYFEKFGEVPPLNALGGKSKFK